jgi:hypothetical protein
VKAIQNFKREMIMGPAIAAAAATAIISAVGTVLAAWVQGRAPLRRVHGRDQDSGLRRPVRQRGNARTKASSQ